MRNKKGQFIKGNNIGIKTQFKVGEKSLRKGKAMTEKTKKKISSSKKGCKGFTGKHTEETKEKIRNAKIKSIKTPRGKNHPNWNGGSSRQYKRGYNSARYKQWRKKVFERDNYTCQKCKGKRGQYITAHHIKGFAKYEKLRYTISNGLTLCEKCHSETDNYKGKAKKC